MSETTLPAILLLADGTVAHGKAFGAIGTTTGEICFNTGMTGYQEVFTDPSYFGQILIMNSAHIGNYGVSDEDVESGSIKINGLIGRNLEEGYSRKLAKGSLQDYLKENCIISSETTDIEMLKEKLAKVPDMDGLELASKVSTSTPYELGDKNAAIKIAVMDYGVKKNILNCMVERGAFLKVFPAKTKFEEVNKFYPDGYFISNGPGDPAPMDYAIDMLKQILKTEKPVFGICLGHQLLALANGISTFKMHHGHRGLNHPVKNMVTGKSEITTQNHGFGVDTEAVKKSAQIEITHVNLNDQSIEGIRVKGKPAFSVQYHPEATNSLHQQLLLILLHSSFVPHDSRYLFDEFIDMIKQSKN